MTVGIKYLGDDMDEENMKFYLKEDLTKYVGKWIAICNKHVVSSGKNPVRVFNEAHKKYPGTRPLLTLVPENSAMIF
ncbi:succinyl-CoA synthetase subunit alpha [Candidatus Woesearchaeota archaeon CG11_big_fil_rev_8_21_14_0_20_43_8]|nr:MAG: succinyl-CoA synthetase subunit alpha [Candidatus Woesearchaeota archaeon CG11_big_fil_rev_8_21_14_0_20_43_8]PIO05293.1 MAG: succinyl-CoA synthetase subunit alpha [Candidatus Woesearchaeota archaeon CG08_land_8_20_14_0_20_43_7]